MFSIKIPLFLFVLIFFEIKCANLGVDPLVSIDQGLVKGQLSADGDYSYFLGIPYAKVDIKRPFAPANPAPIFDGVFNAFESVGCPQHLPAITLKKSLDCLNLNVYVPNEVNSSQPLPVFVWIHGGSFLNGAAAMYEPIELTKRGIIVVIINYRLNAYGFLCLDSPTAPGNQGLKDQYEALVWVRNNIAAFGGDPYNVTLGGQSAGSCSVILHLYSNKEKLYERIVLESGTAHHFATFVDGDYEAATKISNYLGFNTSNTEEALDFLTNTPHELVTAATDALKFLLKPCKEKSYSGVEKFFDTYPFEMTNEEKVRDTPVLIGHTTAEGLDFIHKDSAYYEHDPFYTKITLNFDMDEDQLEEATEMVKHFYIGDNEISRSVSAELIDFETDFLYQVPIEKVINDLIKENAGPIYKYSFNYDGASGKEGTRHNAELPYLFNMPLHGQSYVPPNEKIVARMCNLFANFVKYGNPTPSVSDILPIIWQPVSKDKRPYLIIDEDLEMDSRLNQQRMSFWDLFYVTYGRYNRLVTRD